MEALTCPACRRWFAVAVIETDEDDDLFTCPNCLHSFDPFARLAKDHSLSDEVSLADVVEDDIDDDE